MRGERAETEGGCRGATSRFALAAAALATFATGSAGIVGASVVSCTPDVQSPGELVVAVDTNVALPGKADGFVLTVTRRGVVEFETSRTVGAATPEVLLPATVGVINGTANADPVTVRMMATSAGQIVGLREAVLTVPTDRIALLQLTVDGFCLGDASVAVPIAASAATDGSAPISACDAGLTCVLGSCQTSAVDAAGLPDFVASSAFGTGDAGTCFDSERCFHDLATAGSRGYEPISFARADAASAGCTLALPPGADPERINVGIPADPSACEDDASPCVIPLLAANADEAPQVGFRVDTTSGQIVLPPALCEMQPPVREALVATAFLSAVSDTPLCGSWSRVTRAAGEPTTGVSMVDAAAADASAYVWGEPVDAGMPLVFAAPFASSTPTLRAVPGSDDQVVAWDSEQVQIGHAGADSGAALIVTSASGIGAVTVDDGSVYVAESRPAPSSSVVVRCSLGGCDGAAAASFDLGSTHAAADLALGHGMLYASVGGELRSCALASGSCASSAPASGDQPNLLSPAPDGVFFSGQGPAGRAGGWFVPDALSGMQRGFFAAADAGAGIGEVVSADPSSGTLYFSVADGSGKMRLQRLVYAEGTGALIPVLQAVTPSADHLAASSAALVFADTTSGIYACPIDQPCTDAASHQLVRVTGVTSLALGDGYLYWAVGSAVSALALPSPLRKVP